MPFIPSERLINPYYTGFVVKIDYIKLVNTYIFMESLIEMATKDAENIGNFLKNSFPDKKISKQSLRLKFSIPYVRSTILWEILKSRGFEVTHYAVKWSVPKEQTEIQKTY